jgi:hypothetical protein
MVVVRAVADAARIGGHATAFQPKPLMRLKPWRHPER